jgi:hypothetical protein
MLTAHTDELVTLAGLHVERMYAGSFDFTVTMSLPVDAMEM